MRLRIKKDPRITAIKKNASYASVPVECLTLYIVAVQPSSVMTIKTFSTLFKMLSNEVTQ